MAFICLLVGLVFAATAQTSPPMGIPNLSIGSLQNIPSLDVAPLTIPTNQTINGLANCNCETGCAVLPVELLEFTGRRESTVLVQLKWKTTNEQHNKGFEVQRSLGNSNNFDSIAFVPAVLLPGYENEYALPDNNDFSGISYYRLKQVDLNGSSSFSEIVPVKGYGTEPTLSLYPNPVSDKLTAEIFAANKTTAVLLLTDATQKLLYSANINLNKGINLVSIPASRLDGGLYFVRVITGDNKVLPGKFIKL